MSDPTTRYFAETPCEACDGSGLSGVGFYCPICRGSGLASRTLLTVREVDLEAAHAALGDSQISIVDVNACVQAALGGSVVLVEERE